MAKLTADQTAGLLHIANNLSDLDDVTAALANLGLVPTVVLTQAAYDALGSYDANTIYYRTPNP